MTTPEVIPSTNTKGEGFENLLLELDMHGYLYKVDYNLQNKGGGVSSHSWKPRLTLSLREPMVYQFIRTKANFHLSSKHLFLFLLWP